MCTKVPPPDSDAGEGVGVAQRYPEVQRQAGAVHVARHRAALL